jgi:hypothetical protein
MMTTNSIDAEETRPLDYDGGGAMGGIYQGNGSLVIPRPALKQHREMLRKLDDFPGKK